MPVELRLSSRLTLSGVIVAVLLSASSAFAGGLRGLRAAAAYGQQDYAEAAKCYRKAAPR
jgi:hypothetical protein